MKMELTEEEINKVFSKKNLRKIRIKKCLKEDCIATIVLGIFAFIVFGIKMFSAVSVVVAFYTYFLIAVKVYFFDSKMRYFIKSNLDNINKFIAEKYDFVIKNNLMIKQIGETYYTLKYDFRKNVMFNIDDRRLPLYITFEVQNISSKSYYDLENKIREKLYSEIQKEPIIGIIPDNIEAYQNVRKPILPAYKKIKMRYRFLHGIDKKDLLKYLCLTVELFEENLKNVLIAEKNELNREPLNNIEENKYISYESENQDAAYENIYNKYLAIENEKISNYNKKIIRNVITYVAVMIPLSIIFAEIFEPLEAIGALIVCTFVFVGVYEMLSQALLPSYIFTKKFGMEEINNDVFKGKLGGIIDFYVKPYKTKTYLTDLFPYR